MKKKIYLLFWFILWLFLLSWINAWFFDSVMNAITPWKYVKNVSTANIIQKSMVFTTTGNATGWAIACINCNWNNYFDWVTQLGTTAGTTTFTNWRQQSFWSGISWNDVQNLSISIWGTTAQIPALTNITWTSIQTRCFDWGSQMNEMFWQLEIPHDARTWSILDPHVHRYPTTTSATTTWIWRLDYEFLKNWVINNSVPWSWTITLTVYWFTGNLYKVSDFLADLSTSWYELWDTIAFRIYRVPTWTDTYAWGMCLVQVWFHYQIDSNGSRQKYVK